MNLPRLRAKRRLALSTPKQIHYSNNKLMIFMRSLSCNKKVEQNNVVSVGFRSFEISEFVVVL